MLIGMIFSFFLLNFYRMSLLTFSWYSNKSEEIKKPNFNSLFIKLAFMTLNILFFVFGLQLLLFHSALSDIIIQGGMEDGIIYRMKLLTSHYPLSYVLIFLFLGIFMSPLLMRYFMQTCGSDYDEIKAKNEKLLIRAQFDIFLSNYKYLIDKASNSTATDIIYDKMTDPPFDTSLKSNTLIVVSENELFNMLDKNETL